MHSSLRISPAISESGKSAGWSMASDQQSVAQQLRSFLHVVPEPVLPECKRPCPPPRPCCAGISGPVCCLGDQVFQDQETLHFVRAFIDGQDAAVPPRLFEQEFFGLALGSEGLLHERDQFMDVLGAGVFRNGRFHPDRFMGTVKEPDQVIGKGFASEEDCGGFAEQPVPFR